MWSKVMLRLKRWVSPPVPLPTTRLRRLWMAWQARTPWSALAPIQDRLDEQGIGPIQRDEAFLLFGLVRSIRPNCIVEIGFAQGHSARTFLQALSEDGRVYSIDNNPYSRDLHLKYFSKDPRSIFIFSDQRQVDPKLIQGPVDLVFFDGSHLLEDNKESFNQLRPILADKAMIVVHDTGLWNSQLMTDRHQAILPELEHAALEDGIAHQVQERAFVNWLCEKEEGIQVIHAHSDKTLRHGMSILQRGGPKLSL